MTLSEKYRIIEAIDPNRKRRFGQSFLAESKSDGEKVILKCINKANDHPPAIERLRHESSFTFEINGLPQILDFYESDSEMIMVKKYHEGITLDKHIDQFKRRKKLKELQSLLPSCDKLLAQIHELGIVHCDIKPGNFIVNPSNGSVALIDFGLAIRKSNGENRKMLFPLGYAAPELLLNHLDIVDERTDVFALAITIWRLLDGNLPLVHANPSIFTNLQLTHPLPESDNINKEVYNILTKGAAKHSFQLPPNKMDVKDVKEKLLEAMNNRYSNTTEMIQALLKVKHRTIW